MPIALHLELTESLDHGGCEYRFTTNLVFRRHINHTKSFKKEARTTIASFILKVYAKRSSRRWCSQQKINYLSYSVLSIPDINKKARMQVNL
jgi:hypothetical protein